MGFFSFLKPIKKIVKKIGKGIKKVMMKIGKFMNKIGIVGQIALGLLLPGIGSALGTWAGTASSSVFGAAAKTFVNAAINIGTKVGSVFKTVTQGVTKVIGQTVGTIVNKIPGAGKFIKDMTLGKIDITQMKNFTGKGGVFETAGKALTDTVAAGKDLFSMDTLTGTNKFAIKAQLKKQLATDIGDPFRSTPQTMLEKIQATDLNAPKLADGSIDPFAIDPSMPIDSSISKAMGTTDLVASSTPSSLLQAPTPTGDLFRAAPQTMLEKIQATNLSAEKLADGSIDPFAIDPNMPIDSSILEATGKGVVEKAVVEPDSWITKQVKTAVDKTVGTVTDLPSNLIKQAAGLGPQAAQITNYSSAPAQFTAVGTGADSMLMNTGAIQQDMQAGLQGMFGHPALVYNAEQETANFRRTEAQQMAYRGGI